MGADNVIGLSVSRQGATASTDANDRAAIDRRTITDPHAIVEQMAFDILAARRAGQYGTLVDLTEFGWTPAQAQRWRVSAHAAALDPRVATHDVVCRLRAGGVLPEGSIARCWSEERVNAECEAAVAAALAVPVTGDMTQMLDDIEGDAA